MEKIAILVNLSANHHKAAAKWERIKDKLFTQTSEIQVIPICYTVPFDVVTCVSKLYNEEGITHFISAGGDGSINFLINALTNIPGSTLATFTVGGIGLGSSNDFLKPFNRFIEGIPVKIDLPNTYVQDIGTVFYRSEEKEHQKLFLINASIGLLAKANHTFNKGDRFINFFKSRKLDWAINYTALKTLFTYRPALVEIATQKERKQIRLNSLSVLKNPHVSGNFKFDQSILPNERLFGINYVHGQNIWEVIRTVIHLAQGCFVKSKNQKGRASFKSNYLKLNSEEWMYLETDGEVELVKDATFSIDSRTINIMG